LQMQSTMPIWEPITDVIDDAYMIILSITSVKGSHIGIVDYICNRLPYRHRRLHL
jgi:hypothetical protein